MYDRFLVTDYTSCTDEEISSRDFRNLKYQVFTSTKELLQFLHRAKQDKLQICIDELGDCLLDWS